jgi:hypothetical protein
MSIRPTYCCLHLGQVNRQTPEYKHLLLQRGLVLVSSLLIELFVLNAILAWYVLVKNFVSFALYVNIIHLVASLLFMFRGFLFKLLKPSGNFTYYQA